MLFLTRKGRRPQFLLFILSSLAIKLSLVGAEGTDSENDGVGLSSEVDPDFVIAPDSQKPRPSNVGISLDEFQSLLFTHVDNELGRTEYESGGLNRVSGAEDMWNFLVEFGWEMATMSEGSDGIDSDSFGERSGVHSDNVGAHATAEKSSPFLVCARGGQMSGYERLQPVLVEFGADQADTLVVSNQQDETCRFVTSTASTALSVSGKVVDSLSFAVVPVLDMMKISLGTVHEVSSDRWAIPAPSSHSRALAVMQNGTLSEGDFSNEWDRSIMVGLAPGIGGKSDEECEAIASTIIADVRSMAREGSRRRRLKETTAAKQNNLRRAKNEVEQGDNPEAMSVSDAFSATSTLSNGPGRRHLRSSAMDVWSRSLERGLESSHMCATMFNELDTRLRYGNKGFEYILNPYSGNNEGNTDDDRSTSTSYDAESSASNTDCVISFIAALSTHPYVVTVESNGEVLSDSNSNAQWITQSAERDFRPFFDAGITGAGEVVSVSDSGVDHRSCFFADSRGSGDIFNGKWDFSRRKIVSYDNTYRDDNDQVGGHGSHVAGTMVGDRVDGKSDAGQGIAPDAKLHVFDMKPGDGGMSDPGARRLFESIYNYGNGAKVHNGSWGRSGRPYSSHCQDWDGALSGDYDEVLYVVSAGNTGSGPSTVKNPADCKNTMTVGCSQSVDEDLDSWSDKGMDFMTHWSSRGPTHDGRQKPDLVAPGYNIVSAYGNPNKKGQCSTHDMAGTSMSAPVAAGNAVLVRQYFREGYYPCGAKGCGSSHRISGSLVKAVLVNGAQFLRGVQRVPGGSVSNVSPYDNAQNMGRVDLSSSLSLDGLNDINTYVVDDQLIAAGDTDTVDVTINEIGCSAELSVSLVWYDPPTAAYCTNCIRNNLDLVVEEKSGGTTAKTYYPNGRSSPDIKNTVERVRVNASHGESYRISVIAANFDDPSQKYSLVLTGCFGTASPRETPMPSYSPTPAPSTSPTTSPSILSSNSPSDEPSGFPSDAPSILPSNSPSKEPSGFTSDAPSLLSSYSPSKEPSGFPSDAPTDLPSSNPSAMSSVLPSSSPSGSSSLQSSSLPTVQHSATRNNTQTLPPTVSAPLSQVPTKLPTLSLTNTTEIQGRVGEKPKQETTQEYEEKDEGK